MGCCRSCGCSGGVHWRGVSHHHQLLLLLATLRLRPPIDLFPPLQVARPPPLRRRNPRRDKSRHRRKFLLLLHPLLARLPHLLVQSPRLLPLALIVEALGEDGAQQGRDALLVVGLVVLAHLAQLGRLQLGPPHRLGLAVPILGPRLALAAAGAGLAAAVLRPPAAPSTASSSSSVGAILHLGLLAVQLHGPLARDALLAGVLHHGERGVAAHGGGDGVHRQHEDAGVRHDAEVHHEDDAHGAPAERDVLGEVLGVLPEAEGEQAQAHGVLE
mmetsp:Transcript_36406/g.89713  ORF Transcript_36406/g.89713 Transcript_36406/m.89713 type:complete len:272 (+) Transcript_36406:588-1403(+)